MDKMIHQSTDSWNPVNGVDAVGKTMRAVGDAQPAVPTSKEFDGYQHEGNFVETRSAVKE